MWIDLSDEQRALIAAAMGPLTIPQAKEIAELMRREPDPSDEAFIEAAKKKYRGGTDGDIDWDDVPKVSRGDGGAYVLCWGWVSDEEAGIDDEEEDDNEA